MDCERRGRRPRETTPSRMSPPPARLAARGSAEASALPVISAHAQPWGYCGGYYAWFRCLPPRRLAFGHPPTILVPSACTGRPPGSAALPGRSPPRPVAPLRMPRASETRGRSEEHTSELQSHSDLVCRLLLEKKKKKK